MKHVAINEKKKHIVTTAVFRILQKIRKIKNTQSLFWAHNKIHSQM